MKSGLRQFFDTWTQLCLPRDLITRDQEEQASIRSIVTATQVLIVLLLLILITNYSANKGQNIQLIIAALLIVGFSQALLRLSGSTRAVLHLLALGGFWVTFKLSYYNGGVTSGVIFMIPTTLMALGFSSSFLEGLLWTVINIVGIATVAWLQVRGQWPEPVLPEPNRSIIRTITQSTSFLSAFLIAAFYRSQRSNTQRKLIEVEKKLAQKLEENTTLIRVLSHDISNPLAVIQLAAKQLDGPPSEAQTARIAKARERILRQTENALSILTQVRDLQAIASGKKELQLSSTHLGEAVSCTLNVLQDKIDAKSLKVHFDFQQSEEFVMAEPIALTHQILSNVISNAIKFSPLGGNIWIECRNLEDGVELVIEDQGPGIEDALLESIFSPSAATSHRGAAGEVGTGFGMPIVKAFMERFGGSIQIRSSKQSGVKMRSPSGTAIVLSFQQATQGAPQKQSA